MQFSDFLAKWGPAGTSAALDTAVATAYGWADYTQAIPDETILQRLLALNVERSVARNGAELASKAAAKPAKKAKTD